jgi:hypothetical protein
MPLTEKQLAANRANAAKSTNLKVKKNETIPFLS